MEGCLVGRFRVKFMKEGGGDGCNIFIDRSGERDVGCGGSGVAAFVEELSSRETGLAS